MIPLLFQRIPSLPTRFDCELGSLQFEFSGDCSGGETPVPIPNTAVKPPSADGTARVSVWESRSSPGNYLQSTAHEKSWAVSFFSRPFPSSVPDLLPPGIAVRRDDRAGLEVHLAADLVDVPAGQGGQGLSLLLETLRQPPAVGLGRLAAVAARPGVA